MPGTIVNHPSSADRHVTTNRTIGRDLRASLAARTGVRAGCTWGDFTRAVEGLGVRENDQLASIEYGVAQDGNGLLLMDTDDAGCVDIREGR